MLVLVSLLIGGWYYSKLDTLTKLTSSVQPQLEELTNGTTDYNCLFIGSSRMYVHVNPAIIDSVCHLNSYNFGLKGSSIIEQYMVLKKYIERHPAPKMVVLSLDFWTFRTGENVFNFPDYTNVVLSDTSIRNVMAPYHPIYQSIPKMLWGRLSQLSELSDVVKLKVLFKSKRQIQQQYKSFTFQTPGFAYKGFRSNNTDVFEEPIAPNKMVIKAPINDTGKSILNHFIDMCKKHSIKLVCIMPPSYNGIDQIVTNHAEIESYFKSTLSSRQIPLLDYTGSEMSTHKEYFYNYEHLNQKGAMLFSTQLAKDLSYFQ